ncbi:MAG: porin family protein, partial [Bacteroidales bacterium]|nr:porin family protein [Bacteroidales bacterium]
MKKLLAVILVIFISLPLFSQVRFGLKGGLSTTSLTMENLKTLTSGETQYTVEALEEGNYGFHAGAFVRINISKFYIQPELLFSSRTNEYSVTELEESPVESISKQQFNKLDLPIMLGFYLGPVRLNAGPSASLLINSPSDLIDHPDFNAMYQDLTFGYQAGVGVDVLKRLTIDLRYEGSLNKYQTQISNA